MTESATHGKHDHLVVGCIILVVLIVWGLIAFMPLIALRTAWFSVKTPEDVERVKSVLGQLGTYGDMFGMLSSLFAGGAFVGAAYAVILQRRQLDHQREEMERGRLDREASEKAREQESKNNAAWQRRTALIQAVSFLAQAQTTRLEFLKSVDYNALSTEQQPVFYEEYKKIITDTQQKIDILSVFVKTLAREHAHDVNDPDGLLESFGIPQAKANTGS